MDVVVMQTEFINKQPPISITMIQQTIIYQNLTYEINSVVSYIPSNSQPHYVSYCKHNEKWAKYDDLKSHVTYLSNSVTEKIIPHIIIFNKKKL